MDVCFAGKTEKKLIRRINVLAMLRRTVIVFKLKIDNVILIIEIVSHSGAKSTLFEVVEKAQDILKRMKLTSPK